MAVDAKKLKSYMESKSSSDAYEEDEAEHEEEESSEHEAEESPEYEEAEHEDEEAHEEERSIEDFVGDLYTHAEALSEAAGSIEEPLSHDSMPSPEAAERIQSQLAEMSPAIADGVGDFIVGMPYESVLELAEKLAADGTLSDAEQVAGWLYWCAKGLEA